MNSVLFPTQIIVGRELDEKSHIWLRALSDAAIMERLQKKTGLSYEKAETYITEYGNHPEQLSHI